MTSTECKTANSLITIDSIRKYIQHDILADDSQSIEDDQDLLISGLLDSLNVLRLVTFIEQQCDIAIPPEDLVIEHFGSLSQINAYLKTRQ